MKKLSLALVLALCGVVSALAQNANGRITGVITDPQGAVIPAARITVTNTATHLSRSAESGADGTYQVLDLPIGIYGDSRTLRVHQSRSRRPTAAD